MNRFIKLHITTISIFLLTGILTKAQQVNVQVVYNNTADIKANTETINRIKSAVKITELQTALESNGHITDKNLVIRVAFFDRGVIGQLKLKKEHELTAEKYIEEWQKTVSNKSGILFLFVKEKDGNQYVFYKMVSSYQLETEHLFPLVTEFINEHLSGDCVSIIGNGTKYLAKAVTPVWNDDKRRKAKELVKYDKYKAHHINKFHADNWFGFAFFDLKPATADETKDMKLVNCMDKEKGEDGAHWFISDKYIYTSKENLKGYSPSKFTDWDITFEEDGVKGVYIFYDNFLYKILTTIEGSKKHNPNQIASEWNWKYESKHTRSLSDFTGFSDRTESDRLILYFDESYRDKEGQEISILCKSYSNTWCNVFACDLANEVLFGKNAFGDIHNGPWGSHASANDIHDVICKNDNFKQIEIDSENELDAWDYTNKGFLVYLTKYNKDGSGHIATCYDGQLKKVIHVGGSYITLNKKYISEWNGAQKAHIYFGYILK